MAGRRQLRERDIDPNITDPNIGDAAIHRDQEIHVMHDVGGCQCQYS
jgi:hypothetical protein